MTGFDRPRTFQSCRAEASFLERVPGPSSQQGARASSARPGAKISRSKATPDMASLAVALFVIFVGVSVVLAVLWGNKKKAPTHSPRGLPSPTPWQSFAGYNCFSGHGATGNGGATADQTLAECQALCDASPASCNAVVRPSGTRVGDCFLYGNVGQVVGCCESSSAFTTYVNTTRRGTGCTSPAAAAPLTAPPRTLGPPTASVPLGPMRVLQGQELLPSDGNGTAFFRIFRAAHPTHGFDVYDNPNYDKLVTVDGATGHVMVGPAGSRPALAAGLAPPVAGCPSTRHGFTRARHSAEVCSP